MKPVQKVCILDMSYVRRDEAPFTPLADSGSEAGFLLPLSILETLTQVSMSDGECGARIITLWPPIVLVES